MALPTTISFVWSGSNGSIPASWSRTTAFDGLFPYWTTGDDANTTGGAANHNHSFTSATHAFSAGEGDWGVRHDLILTKLRPATKTHTHPSANSGTGSVTSGATTNEPPWISVIFIHPADSAQTGIPNNAWTLFDAAVPTGWTEPSDCDNKFFKGAAAAGDSNLTGAGSTTHLHSLDHNHPNTNSANTTNQGDMPDATDNNVFAAYPHYHVISFGTADIDSESDANSSLPQYEKLLWGKNETGVPDIQTGTLGFYLGAVADIPANWSRKDPVASGEFIMGAATSGNIGESGGNTQHTHTGTSHNHTTSAGAESNAIGANDYGSSGDNGSSAGHTHTWTVNNATDTIPNNTARSHYPQWIKVILLKYTAPSSGPLLRLLASTGVGV